MGLAVAKRLPTIVTITPDGRPDTRIMQIISQGNACVLQMGKLLGLLADWLERVLYARGLPATAQAGGTTRRTWSEVAGSI